MKSELILRKLTLNDEIAFLKSINQWDQDLCFLFERDYKPGMKFSEFIELLIFHEKGENLQHDFVADTSLFAFIDDEIVGRLAIRHRLNDFLLKLGGHIGYGVLPEHRRKGYATQMLKLSMPFAKNLGIARLLVTCDDNNIGSIKTIEANGGVLENKAEVGPQKPLRRRYWIE